MKQPLCAPHHTPLWAAAGLVALGAFGFSIAAQVLVLFINGNAGASPTDETPVSLARGALVVQSALALLVGLTLRNVRVVRQRALVFGPVSLGMLLVALGLVLGIAPAANEVGFLVSEAMHEPVDTARWVTQIVQRASVPELLLLGFALTLVPACVEELLFRGLLQGALAGAPRVVVLALPALLFGAFHLDWAQGTATFVLGLGFGFLRMTTRSLVAPIVAHATYNLVVLLSMHWMSPAESPAHQSFAVLFGALAVSAACAIVLERYRRISRQPRLH